MDDIFEGKTILLFGGTGSLGKTLINKLLNSNNYNCKQVIVFSRDEAKQYFLRQSLNDQGVQKKISFYIGDIRDKSSLKHVIQCSDIVLNLAALKHIPPYEYMPLEAIKTNLLGVQNIIDIILNVNNNVELFLQISTDKACKPVNVYGMTKALAERIVIGANQLDSPTSFLCVRYGNVLQSRGSMLPFFKKRVKNGLPFLLTDERMTRFLMTLEESAHLIFRTISRNIRRTITVPKLNSVRIVDIIDIMKEHYLRPDLEVNIIGMRPGEKIHEVLIGEEEISRTKIIDNDFIIFPSYLKDPFGINPLDGRNHYPGLHDCEIAKEYSSKNHILPKKEVEKRFEELGILD